MSFWILIQILLNVVLIVGLAVMWVRLNRPQKDDPRMSRGLQLLQSKIAVLEDLSDRTEVQVNQLTSLLEKKCKEIQNKIFDAEDHIDRIDQSIKKSMDVAKIFQDKIPHKEIIERQNTVKFVKAAKLAHQGYSVDQIAAQVELSRGEIEFITKMNKDRLMISEEELPDWAREVEDETTQDDEMDESSFTSHSFQDLSTIFEVPKTDQESLKKLGEEFRKACADQKTNEVADEPMAESLDFIEDEEIEEAPSAQKASPEQTPVTEQKNMTEQKTNRVAQALRAPNEAAKAPAIERDISIRPVEFRRIDLSDDLG